MDQSPSIVVKPVVSRPVQEDDYWLIHRLLVESVAQAPPGFNWDIRQWEGRRFYDRNPGGDPGWHKGGRLWQTEPGSVVGVVLPSGRASAALQVHPGYRHLEEEMVAWAEEHLAEPAGSGERQINFFVFEYDNQRRALLEKRGYQKTTGGGVLRRLSFGRRPLARPSLAPGYRLRTTNSEDGRDAQRIADLLNAAFERDFHNAAEYQNFTRQAPCFRPELDLVAVAPDGTFAAYVGIPYDRTNRRGIFEPVCTHPDHQRQGLAKALMREGLLRLEALGAQDVTVETGDMIPANRLYDSIGFDEIYPVNTRRKTL